MRNALLSVCLVALLGAFFSQDAFALECAGDPQNHDCRASAVEFLGTCVPGNLCMETYHDMVEHCDSNWPCTPPTPLFVDLSAIPGDRWFEDGFTNLEEGAQCNLDDAVQVDSCSWMRKGTAALISIAHHENQLLENGGSFVPTGKDNLFGDWREQPQIKDKNGFSALAEHCRNYMDAQGWVNLRLCKVSLWADGYFDGDPNGLVDDAELLKPEKYGYEWVDVTNYYPVSIYDGRGNRAVFQSCIGNLCVIDVVLSVRDSRTGEDFVP